MNKDVITLLLKKESRIGNRTLDYDLLSINVQTIQNVGLEKLNVLGTIQILPSLVPAYNPGFKMTTFSITEKEDQRTILMNDQVQYAVDLEQANEDFDSKTKPDGRLDYNVGSCSSKTDFELANWSPMAIKEWLGRIQKMSLRFKDNPIRKYFYCLEIRTSTYDDQIKIPLNLVWTVLSFSCFLFSFSLAFIVRYSRRTVAIPASISLPNSPI